MKSLEKQLKAIANRRRLAILKYLKQNKEASVTEIALHIKLSFRSTSRHLAVLSAADILDRNQRSTQMFYRLSLSQESIIRHALSLL